METVKVMRWHSTVAVHAWYFPIIVHSSCDWPTIVVFICIHPISPDGQREGCLNVRGRLVWLRVTRYNHLGCLRIHYRMYCSELFNNGLYVLHYTKRKAYCV